MRRLTSIFTRPNTGPRGFKTRAGLTSFGVLAGAFALTRFTDDSSELVDSTSYIGLSALKAGAGAVSDILVTYPPYALRKAYESRIYESNREIFKAVLKNPHMLYAGGFAFGAFASFPVIFIDIIMYEYLAEKFGHTNAALSAGFFAGGIMTPMENIILRQQKLIKQSQKSQPLLTAKLLYREGGALRFTGGVVGIMAREVTYGSALLGGGPASILWDKFDGCNDEQKPKWIKIADAVSAVTISHPFDRVASEQQNGSNWQRNFYHVAKELYKKGGITELYRGFWWRAFAVIPSILVVSEALAAFSELLETKEQQSDPNCDKGVVESKPITLEP